MQLVPVIFVSLHTSKALNNFHSSAYPPKNCMFSWNIIYHVNCIKLQANSEIKNIQYEWYTFITQNSDVSKI